MKIGLLYGGISFERQVSINSAKSIRFELHEYGKKCNIDLDLIDIDFDNDCGHGKLNVLFDQIKKNEIDLVFNSLHGGDGENGNIQKLLEDMGVAFTGSGSEACKKAMSKSITKNICKKNNIPVPNGVVVSDYHQLFEGNRQKSIVYSKKLIIKPIYEGSSADLYIMPNNSGSANSLLQNKVRYMLNKYDSFLLEEYIEGRELTISILDGVALPVVEIIPKKRFYNYEAKYKPGMSKYLVPAKIDFKIQKEIEKYALELYNLLGCRHYGRIDVRLDDKNNVYLLELNTLPGMTSTSLFPKSALEHGITFQELISILIKLAKDE